jgi:hypothetical protein
MRDALRQVCTCVSFGTNFFRYQTFVYDLSFSQALSSLAGCGAILISRYVATVEEITSLCFLLDDLTLQNSRFCMQ